MVVMQLLESSSVVKEDGTPEEGNVLAGTTCNFSVIREVVGKEQLQRSWN